MTKYRVVWEIDIFADNVGAAAQEALKIQRDPDSTAVIFLVKPEDGRQVEVDLQSGEIKLVKRNSNV